MQHYLADLPAHQAVELLTAVKTLLVRHMIGQVKLLPDGGELADLQAIIHALEVHKKLNRNDVAILIRMVETNSDGRRLTLSTSKPELGKTIVQALGGDSEIELQESGDIGITLQGDNNIYKRTLKTDLNKLLT